MSGLDTTQGDTTHESLKEGGELAHGQAKDAVVSTPPSGLPVPPDEQAPPVSD